MAELDVQRLMALQAIPPDTPAKDVWDRLQCHWCGTRGRTTVKQSFLGLNPADKHGAERVRHVSLPIFNPRERPPYAEVRAFIAQEKPRRFNGLPNYVGRMTAALLERFPCVMPSDAVYWVRRWR